MPLFPLDRCAEKGCFSYILWNMGIQAVERGGVNCARQYPFFFRKGDALGAFWAPCRCRTAPRV